MVLITEGKKCRAIGRDCQAVSEVYGQLLMISIVIIAFSTIALTVFSDGGVVKPEHTPHIDLQENFNRGANTVQIVHSGGEAIDLSAIKIIFSVNGEKKNEFDRFKNEFQVRNPDGTLRIKNPDGTFKVKNQDNSYSINNVFALGDCIEINTLSMSLAAGENIDMFFVDIPSQQVIQKVVLQRSPWDLPDWITPHPYGSVYSSSGGWQPTENVRAINDGIFTNDLVPQRPNSVYQEFQFGVDADEMGISDTLTLVQLKIIYRSPDCSPDEMSLLIYNGSDWVTDPANMTMVEYHTFGECATVNKVYDISSAPFYVNTAEKLEKLKIKFLGTGNAASSKFYGVDFIGIHVEF